MTLVVDLENGKMDLSRAKLCLNFRLSAFPSHSRDDDDDDVPEEGSWDKLITIVNSINVHTLSVYSTALAYKALPSQ